MGSKLLATLGILVYAVVVPALEINDTHVFNPDWPSHARLHEVWQLLTKFLDRRFIAMAGVGQE